MKGEEMLVDAKDDRKEKRRNIKRRRRGRRKGEGGEKEEGPVWGLGPGWQWAAGHCQGSTSSISASQTQAQTICHTHPCSKPCDLPEDFLGPQNVWQKMPAPWTICEVSSPWCYGDVSPGWQKSDVGVLAKVWEPILSSYCSSPLNIPRTFWSCTERTFPVDIVCVSI